MCLSPPGHPRFKVLDIASYLFFSRGRPWWVILGITCKLGGGKLQGGGVCGHCELGPSN